MIKITTTKRIKKLEDALCQAVGGMEKANQTIEHLQKKAEETKKAEMHWYKLKLRMNNSNPVVEKVVIVERATPLQAINELKAFGEPFWGLLDIRKI